ncbi:methyltransferase [Massilia sp. TN1-12]|uniref:methyltransferase n=1 Tax=Massilia paldalensis TaxID=3377675 RepID=UPI00384F380A
MPLSSTSTIALVELGHALRQAGYRFVTITPATHRRVNRRPENAWASDVRGVFGWSRPFRAGVLPPEVEAAARRAGVLVPHDQDGQPGWRSLVRASSVGDCLYFHSAWPTSDEDAVFFGPDTYRYIAAMRRSLGRLGRPVQRAVDIGAGSGAGAIELALQFRTATVYGADINDAALNLVDVNAALNGAANVIPCRSDLLDGVDGHVDLVMSNPPYILDEDELAYRHGGGEHGAALSIDIVRCALERLHAGGSLLLYTGSAIVDGQDRFLDAIRPDLDGRCSGWQYEELDPDIFGGQLGCDGYENVERIAAVWLHAVKAA